MAIRAAVSSSGSKNPTCEANTISAVHGIKMADVVKHEGGEPTMGQSPFALARGLQFERILFRRDAATLIEALVKAGVLPQGSSGFVDLRLRLNGGRSRTLAEARSSTADLLRNAVAHPKRAPAVVAGATVVIPGGVMLPEALLVLDVLALRPGCRQTRTACRRNQDISRPSWVYGPARAVDGTRPSWSLPPRP